MVSLHLVETSLQTDAERAHLEQRENEEVEMIILAICLPNSFHFAIEKLTQVFIKECDVCNQSIAFVSPINFD